MKEFIRVRVFMTKDSPKPILERLVCVDTAISVPFSSVVSSLRWLYGNKCLVKFEVEGYDDK